MVANFLRRGLKFQSRDLLPVNKSKKSSFMKCKGVNTVMIYFPIRSIHNSRIVGVIVTRKTNPPPRPSPPPKKKTHLTNKQKTTTANYNWILTFY